MLDAISDFWKPSKKPTLSEHQANLSDLKIGASIGFGFMPQSLLSGKRREVVGINTYVFGEERLTSYVLGEGEDKTVSMIVADGEEPYLAISRRLQFAERMRMIENAELLALIENADQKRLQVKDVDTEWRQWLVPQYKKEIHGLKGRLVKGDVRTFATLPADVEALDFTYFLLTSTNNEFALEIEMYADNRMEIFATAYRRITDIGEVREPRSEEPMLPGLETKAPAPITAFAPAPTLVVSDRTPLVEVPSEAASEATPEPTKEVVQPHVESTPIALEQLDQAKLVEPETNTTDAAPIAKSTSQPFYQPTSQTTEPPMTIATFNPLPSTSQKQATPAKDYENDTIECELRAANKIIEEAIRNEMRMSDVIRRVIGLPLAGQESVQIPVLLSDDDYKLLAIRYGMNPAEKAPIKARIIEEISDFSGTKR